MVPVENHGALLDRDRDPLRRRLRALLPRLHVLPALSGELDQWADWLLRTRFAHLGDQARAEMFARLESTRDRVLDRAGVQPGEVFADVGAGTGLLALGAAERVGRDGDVLAIDISVDALEELRRAATSANIAYLIGSAEVLPLMDSSIDVVATRSVLIYVRDKAEAAREFFRVLRGGGRVSVFEPINRNAKRPWDSVDFGDLRERVVADFDREWPADDPIHDFDEDDLESFFRDAGFEEVDLERQEHVDELSAEQLLTGVGAPGHRSIRERWLDTFSRDEVRTLEAAVRGAGPIERRTPVAFVSGVKP